MDIVEELKETIADIRNWGGAAMKAWDQSRKLIREGDKSDFPRLIYENTISGYMETMIKAADEIERLREKYEKLLGASVAFQIAIQNALFVFEKTVDDIQQKESE